MTSNKPLGFREVSSTASHPVGRKTAQVAAMKNVLSKGKTASKGPGYNLPEVSKEKGARNPKGDAMKKMGKPMKASKSPGGYYGTKNYDASVWR